MVNLEKKHIISFIMFAILAATVWFIGPSIHFFDQYALYSVEKRCYIIILFFLIWLIFYILSTPNNAKEEVQSTAVKKINFLEGRFAGAIRFLKKNILTKQGKTLHLAKLPWYLLIGPESAGKTSLLVNSSVNFILTKQFKQEKMSPSRTCDWWVTRDIVLVDIPGSYLTKKENFLWSYFFNLIKKYSQQNLKSIVIALPLPELNKQKDPKQKKQIFIDIKQKITQFLEIAPHISFYLVITKCDQIPGFTEFFSECSMEELSQLWGISLPTIKQNESLQDIFVERFNALIKRLNEQLIVRLHQERNANSRPAIKDFPLHMERVKESILNVIQAFGLKSFSLQGIFLTSAKQIETDENAPLHVINSNAPQLMHKLPIMPSKAYFIRQVILQGLLSAPDNTSKKITTKPNWQRYLTYGFSSLVVVIAAFFLGTDYQKAALQISAIENNISEYQKSLQSTQSHEDNLLKVLPLLNALQLAEKRPHYNLSRFSSVLSFYSDKSLKTANDFYLQTAQRIFLPEIKKHLETYLEQTNTSNTVQLYAVLKAYLMLANQVPFSETEFCGILSHLLPEHLNDQTFQNLLTHTHAAFSDLHLSSEINNNLVAEVRKRLMSLSTSDIAFIILKNKGIYGLISTIDFNFPRENSSFFIKNPAATVIANLFTSNAFTSVITTDLPLVANEALRGNDVLGQFEIQPNEATVKSLIVDLRSKYLSSYIDTWENLLANVSIAVPSNLLETDAIITMLMSNSSPLLQLLHVIKENTSFQPIIANSQKIRALDNLLANAQSNEENNLYQIFVSLRQLHLHLQNILTTQDHPQAAFQSARNRLLRSGPDRITQLHLLAEQTPEPMKTWLHALAAQSWFFILKDAGHYVENNWQTNVMTIYRSQLAERFPINPTGTQEVDLLQLANFVTRRGILDQFYQNYLKPFVNDEGKQWQWRVVDNQKLPCSNVVLAQIQEAVRLQKLSKYTLFTKGRKNMAMLRFQLPEHLT